MTQNQQTSLLDDQPAIEDLLDFTSYIDVLEGLIINPDTDTPFTLGVFGRWGTGKTTLMRMLQGRINKRGVMTVWFDAWQYNNETELWAAFLQSVINKMEDKLPFLDKLDFKFRLLLRRFDEDHLYEELTRFGIRSLGIFFLYFLSQALSELGQTDTSSQVIGITGGLASIILGIWFVIRPVIEEIQSNTSINFDVFWKQSNYKEHIAFLDKFREHFQDVIHCLPHSADGSDKRIIIFIDDLDRCSPDRVLQVLDSVKVFVDIPRCVYVLGLDADIVQKAVSLKYKDDLEARREYLGKIIQLPFQLPPLSYHEMTGFLQSLEIKFPDDHCKDVFVAGLVLNPREIKRTINIFFFLWGLANRRQELEGKIEPVRLAKVVVIQHGHPDLHKILQKKPGLLIELESFLQQDISSEEMNIGITGERLAQIASQQENQRKLWDILSTKLSETDIRAICLNLNIDYENLDGENKRDKITSLLGFVKRRNLITDLFRTSKMHAPSVISWNEFVVASDIEFDENQPTLESYEDAAKDSELTEIAYLASIFDKHTSETDIRSICFELDIQFDDLAGSTKQEKIRELMLYLERHGRLSELNDTRKKYITQETIRVGVVSKGQGEPIAAELPSELQPFINESLRRMLILHNGKTDVDYNFSSLTKDAVSIYFTLTSQVESPASSTETESGILQRERVRAKIDNELTNNEAVLQDMESLT